MTSSPEASQRHMMPVLGAQRPGVAAACVWAGLLCCCVLALTPAPSAWHASSQRVVAPLPIAAVASLPTHPHAITRPPHHPLSSRPSGAHPSRRATAITRPQLWPFGHASGWLAGSVAVATAMVASALLCWLRRPTSPLSPLAMLGSTGVRVADARKALSVYIENVVGVPPPVLLGGLLDSLQRQGQALVADPAAVRRGRRVHPLLVPIAEAPDGRLTCLLRRFQDVSGEDLAVVATYGGRRSGLLPLARSVTEAVRRACAEADAAGEAAVLQSLVGSCDAGPRLVYRPGEDQGLMAKYGTGRYITLKIGTFPDLCEELLASHLQRSDKTSAMVVCEKMNHDLPDMAWTQLRQAQLLRQLADDRPLEVRDCARMALYSAPSWTIGFDSVAAATELFAFTPDGMPSETDGSGPVLRSVEDLARHKELKSRDLQSELVQQSKVTPQQVALQRAGYLLDAVALGGGGFDGDWTNTTFRSQLADLCMEAGLSDVAEFVRS